MSENWVEGFNAALLKFLNRQISYNKNLPQPAVKITSYDQDNDPGGCDTCGPQIEVDFYYKCADKGCNISHYYSYWGSLGSIIEEITS